MKILLLCSRWELIDALRKCLRVGTQRCSPISRTHLTLIADCAQWNFILLYENIIITQLMQLLFVRCERMKCLWGGGISRSHLDASCGVAAKFTRAVHQRSINSMHMKKSLKSIGWTMLNNSSSEWLCRDDVNEMHFSRHRASCRFPWEEQHCCVVDDMNSFWRPRSMWFHCQQQSRSNQFHTLVSRVDAILKSTEETRRHIGTETEEFLLYAIFFSCLPMEISSFQLNFGLDGRGGVTHT